MNRLAVWVASVCGAGSLPAPGTAGSLVALLPGAWLLLHSHGWLVVFALLASAVGFWAIPRAGGNDDPGWVVIDEVAGQWVTMLGLSHANWRGVLAAFLLFRLLDITKPGPIGWADRQHGATGVMLDDIIAGAIGAVMLAVLNWAAPGVLA